MSNTRTPDDFADRLRRIEARRQTSGQRSQSRRMPEPGTLQPNPPDPPIRSATHSGIGAGAVMAALVLFAVFVGGATVTVLLDELPFDVASLSEIRRETATVAQASLMALGSLGGSTGLVARTTQPEPETPRDKADDGRILRTPLVAAAGFTDLDIAQIVTGHRPVTPDDFPAAIATITALDSCTPRPLADGETLVNLRVGRGNREIGLQSFSDAALAARLVRNVEAMTTRGKAYDRDGRLSPVTNNVDVFLTDTSAPQYLVLQNRTGAILWNLQPAPGSRSPMS